MSSGSISSSSATGVNAGAHDGAGRADEVLCAEVEDIGIELVTGTVLEDDCVPSF